MALALARPRLWSKTSLGDSEVPTAMALVFDTSLSMGYTERDKTRLDEAKERARTLLKRTHEASRVFVIDSAQPIAPAPLSPVAASKRLDGLQITAVNRPLNSGVQQAAKAVEEMDQPRKEIYVFTDLAATGWELGQRITQASAETPAEKQGAGESGRNRKEEAGRESPGSGDVCGEAVVGEAAQRGGGGSEAGQRLLGRWRADAGTGSAAIDRSGEHAHRAVLH